MKPDKDELFEEYWEIKKTQTALAEQYGVCKSTIANWLKHYGIKLKTMSETKTGVSMPPRDRLFELYWKENESTEEIANRLGIGRTTLARWMIKLKIPRKGFYQATWKNGKYVRKQMKARNVSQNKQEIELEATLDALFGEEEYVFVGDGNFVLGGYNPDFLNATGKNKLIDLFGEAFHTIEEVEKRGAFFGKFGFEYFVVWCKELKDKEKLKEKLRRFNGNSND